MDLQLKREAAARKAKAKADKAEAKRLADMVPAENVSFLDPVFRLQDKKCTATLSTGASSHVMGSAWQHAGTTCR